MDADRSPPGEINPYAAPETESLPAPPPVEAGGFRSLNPLAQAITFIMALMVVANVIELSQGFSAIGVLHRVESGAGYAQSELEAIDQRIEAVSNTFKALYVVACVLFCLFMPRANRNARAFASGPLTFTPGWAAGVFFVPIWSLYKPYRVMKELWQGSDPDPRQTPWLLPVPSLLGWWWGLFLSDRMIQQVVRTLFKNAKGAAAFVTAMEFDMATTPLSIASAVVAAVLVRTLARRQDERQRRHPAGSPNPVVTTGSAP